MPFPSSGIFLRSFRGIEHQIVSYAISPSLHFRHSHHLAMTKLPWAELMTESRVRLVPRLRSCEIFLARAGLE